jgi:hypothetical protein
VSGLAPEERTSIAPRDQKLAKISIIASNIESKSDATEARGV